MNIKNAKDIIKQVGESISKWDKFANQVGVDTAKKIAIKKTLKKLKKKTHITTNLNAKELKNIYGSRVRSRLREMFNLISFDKNSIDKRK